MQPRLQFGFYKNLEKTQKTGNYIRVKGATNLQLVAPLMDGGCSVVAEMETISQSEAARRAGISRAAIQKHLKVGRIKSAGKNKVELTSFNSWLDSKQDINGESIGSSEATKQLLQLLKFDKLQDAELHKRSYEAHLKQLEYDEKSGAVVKIEDVVAGISAQLSAMRTRLLAIPAEMAPQIFTCKTVAETQDKLHKLMIRTLEELSEDERWKQHLQTRETSLLDSPSESTKA